jgi:aspartokinase/homoserine dehydrogenase 1
MENSQKIEIWTDTDGLMTANPRKVKKAFPIKEISYIEAMEMCHFGVKIIHQTVIQEAQRKNIPIVIKNKLNPDFPGTVISKKTNHNFIIQGISSISDIALLRLQGSGMVGVPGVSKRLFGALSNEKINIILISQASSEHSICFAVEPNSAEQAKNAIESEFSEEIKNNQIDPVFIEKNLSIIAIVGENMRHTPGISAKLFSALGKNGINISAIAQGSSELNISTVISKIDEEKALNAIHDAFFLSGTKTLIYFSSAADKLAKQYLNKFLNKVISSTKAFRNENYRSANSKK